MRIVAVVAAENHRAGELRMPELAMRPLATRHKGKPRPIEVGDQLTNLAWHTWKSATRYPLIPALIPAKLYERIRDMTSEHFVLVKTLGMRS